MLLFSPLQEHLIIDDVLETLHQEESAFLQLVKFLVFLSCRCLMQLLSLSVGPKKRSTLFSVPVNNETLPLSQDSLER